MKSAYGPGFGRARAEAIERSNGACQFCGQRAATDGHHWAMQYPDDSQITASDITALCGVCHEVATTLRRLVSHGGTIWQFMGVLREAITQCDIRSPSSGLLDSSSTTALPGSTPAALPTSKRAKSLASAHRTGRKPTILGLENLSAKPVSISTVRVLRPSRRRRSAQ